MAIELPEDVVSGGGPFSTYEDTEPGYQPSSKTAGDVLARVQRTFGDESGVQLADDDVWRWVNDGQEEIVNRNRILKTRAFTYSIAGVTTYRYPTDDIEQVESLHYDGALLPNVTFAQAERTVMGQTEDGSEPRMWWEWGGSFTLWPTPITPKQITIYYTTRPTGVTGPNDPLSIPDKYFQSLVTYVLQQAYEMDEDWQASQAKGQQFDTRVTTFGEEERTAQRMTYETITIVDEGY